MPLAARYDFFWPEHPESASNHQYLFLNDILVAPIWDSGKNLSGRSVWLLPGDWQDAWDGSVLSGPQRLYVSQPDERMPMWHARGGLLVLAGAATRVEDQDWRSLTLEAFPDSGPRTARRTVVERRAAGRTELALSTDGVGGVRPEIGAGPLRAWMLRLHLRASERAAAATVDGQAAAVRHLQPGADGARYFPLSGAGTAPAPLAGSVAEITVPAGRSARAIVVNITSGEVTV